MGSRQWRPHSKALFRGNPNGRSLRSMFVSRGPKLQYPPLHLWITHTELGKKVVKKQRPPSKVRPQRADILVIKMKEASSYAEMLKSMKTDPELKELKESITKIWRTNAGSMLFELDRKAHQKRDQLSGLVKTKLRENGDVTCRTDTMMLELKDLDEVTDKVEIVQALQDQLERVQDIDVTAVKSLRKAYGGMQTAVVVLPVDIANKALNKGKIKVGWVVSRVRQKSTVQQCFKCLGFGHLANKCTGPDRSKLCRKCGREEHIAKNCTAAEPHCLLCDGKEGSKHQTGSFACRAYKQALQASTKPKK